MAESENLITRINYDPRLKYGVAALVFASVGLALRSVDGKNSSAHLFLIPTFAAFRKAIVNDNDPIRDIAFGSAGSVTLEMLQAIYPILGQAQIEDLGVDAAGIAVWFLFEGAAKKLHESGITDPIYSVLGITKRGSELDSKLNAWAH